jgi:hypothetical protein
MCSNSHGRCIIKVNLLGDADLCEIPKLINESPALETVLHPSKITLNSKNKSFQNKYITDKSYKQCIIQIEKEYTN